MSKRKAISTRTRFEIFKRDSFTCQYCGRKPPTVVLWVDHVMPVSKGGDNAVENLLTSCDQCNLGKSDVPLERIVRPAIPELSAERERLAQFRQYQTFLEEKRGLEDEWFRIVSDHWIQKEGKDPQTWMISGYRAGAVRQFLKKLTAYEVMEAVDCAYKHLTDYCGEQRRVKYFCGVCWKKIRANEEGKCRSDS